MTEIIHLPQIPTRQGYADNGQFFSALRAWENVCREVVRRSTSVQPAAMPQPEQFLNREQFLVALAAWEAVFCREDDPTGREIGLFELNGARVA